MRSPFLRHRLRDLPTLEAVLPEERYKRADGRHGVPIAPTAGQVDFVTRRDRERILISPRGKSRHPGDSAWPERRRVLLQPPDMFERDNAAAVVVKKSLRA